MGVYLRERRRAKGSVWIVDYRDAVGRRRWQTYASRVEAERVKGEKEQEARQAQAPPAFDPDATLAQYVEYWLRVIAPAVKPRTLESYRDNLRLHILPRFGTKKVRELHKGTLRLYFAEKLAAGASRATVKLLIAILRACLMSAMDDLNLHLNPAAGLGRKLGLGKAAPDELAEEPPLRALTPAQVAALLEAAKRVCPRYAPMFLLLARTGLRLGEAAGLRWDDLDLSARTLAVRRTFSKGRLGTPKSRQARTVDVSRELAATLRRLEIERKTETLRRGWEMPPWAFVTGEGRPISEPTLRAAFLRALKAAGLPPARLHDLRHSFAVHLLQSGAPIAYVKEQLGHAGIQVTVDTYGRFLPTTDRSAVDRLDTLAQESREAGLATAAEAAHGSHERRTS